MRLVLISTAIVVYILNTTQVLAINCSYKQEIPSKKEKKLALPKYGITIKVPTNFYKVDKDDYTEIVDKGTFNTIQCMKIHPNALGAGDSYYSIDIAFLSNKDYASYTSVKKLREGVSLAIKKSSDGYTTAIVVSTKVGLVTVMSHFLNGLIEEKDLKSNLKDLKIISKNITIK